MHLLEGFDLHWYNPGMRKNWLLAVLVVLISLLFSACTQQPPNLNDTPTSTVAGTLRPYPSATPSATPLPTDYTSPTPSPTVTPTPTQVFYEVQTGDDMYSIAFRYGLSPQAIMTANPTVNPRIMSVGTTLLIPITPVPGTTQTATPAPEEGLSPTPTQLYSQLRQPDCHPDALGGLWCFVLVENDEDGALENVSAVVELEYDGETRQEIAVMPLNLLPAGQSLPLIAYFQPPLPGEYAVTARVDFLLPVMSEDDRYLDVTITEQSTTLREEGRAAEITGALELPGDRSGVQYVWVHATAYDAAGQVVAVRRWDKYEDINADERILFEFSLYSLAGAIESVDVLVEARAIQEPTATPQP